MSSYTLRWSINSNVQYTVVDGLEEVERNRKNIVRRKGYDVDSFSYEFEDADSDDALVDYDEDDVDAIVEDDNDEDAFENMIYEDAETDYEVAELSADERSANADECVAYLTAKYSDNLITSAASVEVEPSNYVTDEGVTTEADAELADSIVPHGYISFREVAVMLGVRYQQVYQRAFKLHKIRVYEGKVYYAHVDDVNAWIAMRNNRNSK